MDNKEKNARLEEELKKRQTKKRFILLAVLGALLILGILFLVLREATKEVVTVGGGILKGWLSYKVTVYGEGWTVGCSLCFGIALLTGILLLCDLVFCRFRTKEVNGHYITVYRGALHRKVYVNGEEKSSGQTVTDLTLPDGVKVCVTVFCRGAFAIAHLSFSDDNASVDI